MPWKNTPEIVLAKVLFLGPDDCALWQGGYGRNGYGRLHWRSILTTAHRVVYEILVGPIPKGLQVCHSCDVRYPLSDLTYRRCCNPTHLWLGTNQQNIEDKIAKGRQPMGERHGAFLHPECMEHGDQHWSRRRPEIVPRGEHACHAILTEKDIPIIRDSYDPLLRNGFLLAEQFGVSRSAIQAVVKYRTWKHLP